MSNAHTTAPQKNNLSFSGHQTFPFRYTWLKKGVDAVREDPTVFSSENASVTLGVGKNMVSSIRHWCKVSRLIETDADQRGRLVPTELGKAIFDDDGFDPYLDAPATLWLIHWQIATNINQATTWYWAFNIFRENQFARDIFKIELHEWALQQKTSRRPVSDNTLQRDVNCFIRTYCQSAGFSKAHQGFGYYIGQDTVAVVEEMFDCPLVELNLIAKLPDSDRYEFQRGEKKTLPIEIVAWALVSFWERRFSSREALPFSELMYAQSSPGRIFRLDEDSITVYLEKLEKYTDGALQYDETADLKQVYRHSALNEIELLERCYGKRSSVRSLSC